MAQTEQPPEDVVFLFDLERESDKIVPKRAIVKDVIAFVKQTEQVRVESNYGIVVFKEGENPVFMESLAEDEKGIELLLKDNLQYMSKSHSLEHGIILGLTYLIEAYRVTQEHVERLIIISDGPIEERVEMTNAVIDLLENVKYFPLFVDIIRIGTEGLYQDAAKMTFWSKTTNGTFVAVATEAEFKAAIDGLVLMKHEEGSFVENEKHTLPPSTIPEEYKSFYEEMCFPLDQMELPHQNCAVCGKYETIADNNPLLSCDNCGALYHEFCALEVAKNDNIGFVHIFRCKKCQGLLLNDEKMMREYFGMEIDDTIKGLAERKTISIDQEQETVSRFVQLPTGKHFHRSEKGKVAIISMENIQPVRPEADQSIRNRSATKIPKRFW
jgi:hypothetical protein